MGTKNIGCLMEKILILEGGFNEEHEISLNTAKEIKRSLTNLNISFDSLLVKPQTFSEDINHYNNDTKKFFKILKRNKNINKTLIYFFKNNSNL